MRSRTSNWFEVKVRYPKTMDNGTEKSITELYTVDALTFSEAESRIIEEISKMHGGDLNIMAITRAPYGEVFFADEGSEGDWFKVKVAFITIDEKTNTEKRCKVTYLVEGDDVKSAERNTHTAFAESGIDYTIEGINKTNIMDIYEHE